MVVQEDSIRRGESVAIPDPRDSGAFSKLVPLSRNLAKLCVKME